MEIDIFDVAEAVKINKLKIVSNPMLFAKNAIPSPDGLLSTDIFGVSIKDRKNTYAAIDLKDYYIHPFIYKLLKRMDRRFESIVHGNRKFIIENGVLKEDEENGSTGLKFLYDNWNSIKFEKNNSNMRGERIDVLSSHKRDEIFLRYWIVIPAFYRDVNLQSIGVGKISHHEINDKYSKLIRLSTTTDNANNFDFVLNGTKARVQETLVEIYDLLKGKLEKKTGKIRKDLLGKSIDYGSRSVITSPIFKSNRPEDMGIDFYHVGVPLGQCCSLFTPFIIHWVKNYFQREFKNTNKYPYKNDKGQIEFIELDNPDLYFNEDYIKKQVDNFIFSYGDRFTPIELPTKDKTKKVYFTFISRDYVEGMPESDTDITQRYATWCDILYQAAVDVTQDKMVWITRYPVTDYFGTFPNQVTVLSTQRTKPVMINNRVYPKYPVVEIDIPKHKVATSFIDTISMSNLYLMGIGGDNDGDQVSVKGVYSQEANEESRQIMMAKSNILNIYGENMRTTTNEGIQTLYMLTKF